MATEERVTFCRICEALCGMVATVEDGRVVKLRPDRAHPLSSGYACPKGIAMAEVQNDPDRVLRPLRRRADGSGFDEATWEQALADIGPRLRAIVDRHGPASLGWYMGNPGAFSYSHAIWVKGLLDAVGSPHYYTASSQDVSNRFAASALLYGSPLVVPFPDLPRTDMLLIVGANPLVSHGSVLTAPRIKDELGAIVARGGRVVCVDPRATETARAFEHVPVAPDTDAWLLLSLLHVVFADGLEDRAALRAQATGVQALRTAVAAYPPERTEARTGVPAATVRALARDLAAAGSAAVYGRTGSCLGRFGTLVAMLLDALNVATGNLDRPGGSVFGRPAVALDEIGHLAGVDTYGDRRSRFGGFPDVVGALPATNLAREIATPGAQQIRAMFVSAGNPVLSVPDGDALEHALTEIDLCVAIDLYVNETHRHADWVLPATTFLERDDIPVALLGFHVTPFVQHSDPVVEPAGEAREEWQVIEALGDALGVTPSSLAPVRALGRLGIRISPQRMLDGLLRIGPDGDWFGLRPGGLSVGALRRERHGRVTAPHVETGMLERRVRHRDRRVHLDPPGLRAELVRLGHAERAPDPVGAEGEPLPLRLIGLRELRSHNSWMHNAPLLMRGGRRHALRIGPDDAAAHGLADGGEATLTSASGSLTVPVTVTDELAGGTVALPHGWGHRGGGRWRVANAHPGVNVNVLAPSGVADIEPMAGMAFLNGIPVRVAPVPVGAAGECDTPASQPAAVRR